MEPRLLDNVFNFTGSKYSYFFSIRVFFSLYIFINYFVNLQFFSIKNSVFCQQHTYLLMMTIYTYILLSNIISKPSTYLLCKSCEFQKVVNFLSIFCGFSALVISCKLYMASRWVTNSAFGF